MDYIYKITNLLNQKVYIGQTVNPGRRWTDHKWLSSNNPIQYIHRAMAKDGIENFTFTIIASSWTDNQKDIDDLETMLINQYDSRNKEKGYNIAPGGAIAWNKGLPKELNPLTGIPRPEAVRQKLSVSLKGNKNGLGNHSGLGKTQSEETKLKRSESLKGHPGWNKGLIRSEESKCKTSETVKANGGPWNKGIPNPNKGVYRFTPEEQTTICQAYLAGKSSKQIGRDYTCSSTTIIKVLRLNRIDIRA